MSSLFRLVCKLVDSGWAEGRVECIKMHYRRAQGRQNCVAYVISIYSFSHFSLAEIHKNANDILSRIQTPITTHRYDCSSVNIICTCYEVRANAYTQDISAMWEYNCTPYTYKKILKYTFL